MSYPCPGRHSKGLHVTPPQLEFFKKNNTLNGTTVSCTYGKDVSFKAEGSPAANPSGRYGVGKFINATNQCAGA
ncbi:MAG: hypothetical protein U9N61_00650 [Euryarchaeota archaeon]|nr:hypothetical protein [Euryarchaeota archaeon]